jgi:hypothetical protein
VQARHALLTLGHAGAGKARARLAGHALLAGHPWLVTRARLAGGAPLAAAVLVRRQVLGWHPLSGPGLRRRVGLRGHRLAAHALLVTQALLAGHPWLVTHALARHRLLPGRAGRGRRDAAQARLARDTTHGLLAGQRLARAGLPWTGLARHARQGLARGARLARHALPGHGLLPGPAWLRRPSGLALARTGVSLRLGNARLRLQS